jgi:hypothetical protein
MEHFKTKTDCLQFALAEIIASLTDDLFLGETSEREHYSDEDRASLAAKIADIQSIEPEAIEALEEHLKRAEPVDNSMLKIINDKGRAFNVRRVKEGDKYGLNDCLTHGPDKLGDLIEFYDASTVLKTHGDRGQFVTRYYVRTLQSDSAQLISRGLCLNGGVPVWTVDAGAMLAVIRWIQHG